MPLWADSELANIVRIGVITGKNGSRLAPSDALTRAEAAATIRRLLQKTGLI